MVLVGQPQIDGGARDFKLMMRTSQESVCCRSMLHDVILAASAADAVQSGRWPGPFYTETPCSHHPPRTLSGHEKGAPQRSHHRVGTLHRRNIEQHIPETLF